MLLIALVLLIVVYFFISYSPHCIKYYVYYSNIDPLFVPRVNYILANSRWHKWYNFQPTDCKEEADIYIKLKPDKYMDKYENKKEYYPSGKEIRWSVTVQSPVQKPRIYINANSWLHGVEESKLSLAAYRTYVINHEFGHALGFTHQPCTESDPFKTCPVMYQSTRGCPKNKHCGRQPVEQDRTKIMPEAYLPIYQKKQLS